MGNNRARKTSGRLCACCCSPRAPPRLPLLLLPGDVNCECARLFMCQIINGCGWQLEQIEKRISASLFVVNTTQQNKTKLLLDHKPLNNRTQILLFLLDESQRIIASKLRTLSLALSAQSNLIGWLVRTPQQKHARNGSTMKRYTDEMVAAHLARHDRRQCVFVAPSHTLPAPCFRLLRLVYIFCIFTPKKRSPRTTTTATATNTSAGGD